ncbi:MAG: four helix bundle protein [Patescibacteria group bacterium]
MKRFTDLEAWKVAIELLKENHAITKKLPAEERFGLVQQMRKSAMSILANIAEGFGRYTYDDKANRFVIARGECNELEAFCYGIIALDYLSSDQIQKSRELIEREEKLLSGLISSCRKRSALS